MQLRWHGDNPSFGDLRLRMVDPARDRGVPVTVSVDVAPLDDADLVVVGRLAGQLRLAAVRLVGATDERAVALVEAAADGRLEVIARQD